jgi:hypothetical protein
MATRITCLLILLLALTGYSGMRIVDSDVQAFTTRQGVTVPADYRFERLPSQQGRGEPQERLEAMVQVAMAGVGMARNDAQARYSVSIELRIARDPRAPWDDPLFFGGFHHDTVIVTPSGAVVRYPSFAMQFDSPYYRREVHLLVRRLSDGVLVFESRANHDGRWSDDAAVLPAMFEAALQGFPNPPQGARRVNIEIPR